MNIVAPEAIHEHAYDVVVVGAGITGSIIAKTLAAKKKHVLVLEAGTADGASFQGYTEFLSNYYTTVAKVPQAPYLSNPNAPQPSELDPSKITPTHPDTKGYFIQNGPLAYRSTYTRYLGGTTLHWLGTSLRMLPDDFRLKTLYGVADDWPISYADLMPFYERAEEEMGVSADVKDQAYGGVYFSEGYEYPMHGLPPTFSDRMLAKALAGKAYKLEGHSYDLSVISTPASRNGIPNKKFNRGHGYRPAGAVGKVELGNRCMGNSSCVPICPIQAKYNAMKTLSSADPRYVTVIPKAVASRIEITKDSGRVTGIVCKHYQSMQSPEYREFTAKGKVYVLAAHAIENAKLLLASDVGNRSSGLVGCNLMDHTELLTWGEAPMPVWPFRGPVATSGIEGLRNGPFRSKRAAFRIELGNDGWAWPAFSPGSDVNELIDKESFFGTQLRRKVLQRVQKQFRFGILVEQLPAKANRVTIDSKHLDRIGNYRPILSFDIADYTRAGFELAKQVSDEIFQHFGAKDRSTYSKQDPGYFEYNGQGYIFQGAGHYMGTHRMGSCRCGSVVNPQQRSWDHDNLFMVGCGNIVTSATSNPTLTAASLTFMAAAHIAAAVGA
jgi:choline dehydrogenase-like flavoprotein